MSEILIFVAFGALTGLLAGLLGIGGGVIAVPVLYYTLGRFGYPHEDLMHIAVATSLASTIITALGASWSHHQKKAIRFDAFKPILLGLLFGCGFGAMLAVYLGNELLRYIFGSAVVPLSVYFFFPKLPSPRFAPEPNRTLSVWSLFVGFLSTVLGIGGGLFFIPILLGYGLPIRNAIATSSVSTFASAFFATTAFLFLPSGHAPLPHTIGYVCIPAFLAMGLSSLLTTSIGAGLAHKLPTSVVKRIFACALLATGLTMIFGKA